MANIYAGDPPTKVSDLREISFVTIAISIWNHFNPSRVGLLTTGTWRKNARDGDEWMVLTNAVCNSTPALPGIPDSIAKWINVYTKAIGTQMEDWVAYHHRSIYYLNGADNHLYRHIPYFSWYLNGTIDYKQTARNLLSTIRLSEVEKYKFLCTYCLKDEMEEMIARVPYLLDDTFVEVVDFASHPLIYYWNCYFRKEMHKISTTPTDQPFDRLMFNHEKVNNWPAKEYFFDRLSSDDKIRGAISLIDKHGARYQKLVMLKLNFHERVSVYMQKSDVIMLNYAKTGLNFDDVISTWFELRDLISTNQFLNMFDELMKAPNVAATLKEIWISANDRFKKYLLNFNHNQEIGEIFQVIKKPNDSDFLFTVLSEVGADIKKKITKKQFFSDLCDDLFAMEDVALFDRLIKECLPAQEQQPLKQHLVINSKYVKKKCLSFYSVGQMDQVDELLALLLPSNPDVIQTYKIDLIMSPDGIVESCRHFISNEPFLESIMKDCLRTDDLITQFKKQIIWSPSSVALLRATLAKKELLEVKQYVDSYLTSNEEKTAFKKRLLETFDNAIVKIFAYESGIYYIKILLEWCLGSEDKVEEYKLNLNVDGLFDKLLTAAIFLKYESRRLSACTFNKIPAFEPLDQFLTWYFESKSKIKEYKLLRADSYNNIGMINTLMKKKDDWYLKWVMNWFFDRDLEEIEKFKKKHPGRISYVINV